MSKIKTLRKLSVCLLRHEERGAKLTLTQPHAKISIQSKEKKVQQKPNFVYHFRIYMLAFAYLAFMLSQDPDVVAKRENKQHRWYITK